jgi:hypothetical protein
MDPNATCPQPVRNWSPRHIPVTIDKQGNTANIADTFIHETSFSANADKRLAIKFCPLLYPPLWEPNIKKSIQDSINQSANVNACTTLTKSRVIEYVGEKVCMLQCSRGDLTELQTIRKKKIPTSFLNVTKSLKPVIYLKSVTNPTSNQRS